jgi:hypothetical protein
MNASDLTRLAAIAEDVAAADGGLLAGVRISEAADGSGRSIALVDMQEAGLEQQYRISSPAPATSPSWARVEFGDWRLEVRVGNFGGEWMELELELPFELEVEVQS